MSKLIDAEKLKKDIVQKTLMPSWEIVIPIIKKTIDKQPAVLLSCPKCHGKGVYEVAVFDEENEVWTGEAENVHCELCHATGKVSIEFYEEIQKASREK